MPRIKKEEVQKMTEKNKEMSKPRVPKNDAITVKRLHRKQPEEVPIGRALPTIPLIDPVKQTNRIKLGEVEHERVEVSKDELLQEPRELTKEEETKILEYIEEVKEQSLPKEEFYKVEDQEPDPESDQNYIMVADGMGEVETTAQKIEKIAMYFGSFCCGLIVLGIVGIILALIVKLIMFIL